MRSLNLRAGFREAGRTFGEAGRLMRHMPLDTALLALVLAVLPSLGKGFFFIRHQEGLWPLWDAWFLAARQGRLEGVLQLLTRTASSAGSIGLWATLIDLGRSLVLTPLMLSAFALLYNGYVRIGPGAGLRAARDALGHVKDILLVAIVCALAQLVAQAFFSLISGLISLVAELFFWIPFLGGLMSVLALVLSALLSLLVDFAVFAVFCYVWIGAACEGIPGIGALVRSWQMTRDNLRPTVFTLLLLTLLRLGVTALVCLLGALLAGLAGLSAQAVAYAVFAVSGVFAALMGPVASALYQRRPAHMGPRPGQFRRRDERVVPMKRANID